MISLAGCAKEAAPSRLPPPPERLTCPEAPPVPAKSDDKVVEDKNRADWISGLYAAWAECWGDVNWNRAYWER